MKKLELTRILFVINPKSGTGSKGDFEGIISRISRKEGFDYEIYKTTGTHDNKAIKQHIREFRPNITIAVGGDGTINLVATELLGSRIKLGLIPTGSANGLAFNLGIPKNFEDALYHNIHGDFKPFDIIQINNSHYCLHLSDVGINARIVKRFEKEGDKGFIGYGKQLFNELFSSKSVFKSTIKINKKTQKIKAAMVVVANARSFGTGVLINPTGKPNDGKFEIVVIKPYPWWFIFTFLYAGFAGKLHKMQYVKVLKASEADIIFNQKLNLQIDGEVLPQTDHVQFEILPSALQVIAGEERD